MSRHHARGARRERQTAEALNTRRVVRAIGESAPDVVPTRLPSGLVLMPEVKERARPLATLARWLRQAEGYAPEGAVALVVVHATGAPAGEALVVLRLEDFRRVGGLAVVPAQGVLPMVRR